MQININSTWGLLTEKLTDWYEIAVKALPNFALAVVILVGFWALSILAKKLVNKLLPKQHVHQSLRDLLSSIVKVTVVAAGLFFALGVLNLDKTVTSLLAGAGIIGLALGFAFQDIAANFVSGLIIAIKQPYNIGDIIEVNDYKGVVEAIGFRTTKLRSFQGVEVLVPNQNLMTNEIQNYTETKDLRIDLACGVSYGDDLDKVEKVVKEALVDISGRQSDKDVEVFYEEFGGSSINFKARVWIDFKKQMDFIRARHEIVKAIKKAFDNNDIAIPFPIRTLDFDIKGGENLVKPLSAAFKSFESNQASSEAQLN